MMLKVESVLQMKLERFKERDNKRIGIIVFTIACILLVSGVILYRTFAIFEVKTNQNMINGSVQSMGDLEFAFYKDNDIVKEVPSKEEGYSLDTSSSYCVDLLNGEQVSNVSWNDERWSIELKDITTTKTKCYLHFKKIYKEEELHGAIPDLMNGRLVPIVILNNEAPSDIKEKYLGATGGKVLKADITKTEDPWYSYKDKKWANAVILKDGKTDTYKPGDEIPESEIESYFVWIPRYKYKLKNSEEEFNKFNSVTEVGNVDSVSAFYSDNKVNGNQAPNNAFEIEFETKNGGVSTTALQEGDWITHPAFTTFDSNGIWVAKFETGYNQNTDTTNVIPTSDWSTQDAQHNETNSTKVIIKPHVDSWRNINVSNAFYTSYEYKRELESHMMKNTEWGAVAYLTQSKYGRCDSNNTNCTEVSINNSEYYITGMSTTISPTCGYTSSKEQCNYYGGPSALNVLDNDSIKSYYLTDSQGGSTTGNYSGIYDMSGGGWEYVMGVMQAKDGDSTPTTGPNATNNSGFNGPYSNNGDSSKTDGQEWPSRKYYDLYDYSTSHQYQRGQLGDATKEFGPFYSVNWKKTNGEYGPIRYIGSYNTDAAFFIYSSSPWFIRGGGSTVGTETGVEAFGRTQGKETIDYSFRIVLTP